MKRSFTAAFTVSLLMMTGLTVHAQDRGNVESTYSGGKVSIDYGRPALKGRDMLGRATDGMVWRFGMNQGTTITTEADLQFGDVSVPAGSYTILAKKVGDSAWHLILNKATDLWGTDRDESQDLQEIPFKVSKTESPVEVFTIELHGSGSSGTMKAMWGGTSLAVDFQVK